MRNLTGFCAAAIVMLACTTTQAQKTLVNSGKLLNEGRTLHDGGKYKEAIALYSQINRSDTNYNRALYELSLSNYSDSNYTKSLQYAQAGMQFFPEQSDEWYGLMGSAYDDLGKTDSAIYCYDKALQQNPYGYTVYFNKGVMYYRLKKWKEAKENLQQAVLISPYYASAHYFLGATAMQEGNLPQALMSYITCLLINPQTNRLGGAITNLTNIARTKDEVLKYVSTRKSSEEDNFDLQQEILVSKIALDAKYKLQSSVEDPIVRQVQVMLEKLEYNKDDKGFWMQYYVPFFQNILSDKDFNVMVNYMFSGLNIKQVQDYVKKNKKEMEPFINKVVAYLNTIRNTHVADFEKRKTATTFYTFDNNAVSGKGKWDATGKEILFIGPWEFYYSTGQLKSKGSFGEKENKEGTWTYYNDNGGMDAESHFKENKLEGKRISLFDNGLTYAEENYINGELDGVRKQYFYNGMPRYVETYTSGKRNGKSTGYENTGALYFTANYKDDELDGEMKYYHYNGKPASVYNYKMGKVDGPIKKYNEQGGVVQEGAYVNDIADGPWKEYHDNGKLWKEYTYVQGKMDGDYKEYYPDGKLMEKIVYVKGDVTGKSEDYDEDGILYSDVTYEKGRLREINFYDKAGKSLSSISTRKGDADITFYNPKGYKTDHSNFTRDGQRTGKSTYYYRTGEVSGTAEYKDGDLQGEKILYYPGGAVQERLMYEDGDENGYQTTYFKNGKTKREVMYVAGDRQGEQKDYNALGNIITNKYFLNDVQSGYTTFYHPGGKIDYEQKYYNDWPVNFIQYDTLGKVISSAKLEKGKAAFTMKHYNGKDYIRGIYNNYHLDGPYEILYFDGSRSSMEYYKQGYADSIFKGYYWGGNVKTEGRFVHGNKDGEWKYYYKNGKLYLNEKYVNGNQNGKEEMYNEDGMLMREYNYVDDNQEGEFKLYGDNNEVAVIINFHKDEPVSYTYTGKDGKNVPAIPLVNGGGKLIAYYKNGNKSAEIDYINGKVTGKRNLWFTNGKPYVEGTQDEDSDTGPKKTYNPAGQLVKDEEYLYGNQHGVARYYYPSGKIMRDENWYNGELHGITKMYDETGKLQTRYYYYDILQSVK